MKNIQEAEGLGNDVAYTITEVDNFRVCYGVQQYHVKWAPIKCETFPDEWVNGCVSADTMLDRVEPIRIQVLEQSGMLGDIQRRCYANNKYYFN